MFFRQRNPGQLGVRDGRLVACPDSPNCVSTQAEGTAGIAPLRLTGSVEDLAHAVDDYVAGSRGTRLVRHEGGYFHLTSTSLLLRFIDDLEIWADREAQLIHARSASREGYSDFGVNRRRVKQLFDHLQRCDVAVPLEGRLQTLEAVP